MSDNNPPAPPPAPAAAPSPAPTPAPAPAVIPAPAETTITPPAPSPSPVASAAPTPAPSVAPSVAPVLAAPVAATAVHHYSRPPTVHHLSAAPTPYRPSTLPQQLKRLAYIVSLVLGGSAVLAGVWSAFLLPLLHATYSARTALVAPQADRWRGIVDRLRDIRLTSIFPEPTEPEAEEEVGAGALVRVRTRGSEKSKGSKGAADKEDDKDAMEKALEKKVPDAPGSATIAPADGETEETEPKEPGPNRIFGDVSPLSVALRDLASSLGATATTRTSLVSTLEGYTSGLHRELFISRGGQSSVPWGPVSSTSRVGLGTLGANLAKAGGGEQSPLGLPAAKSEEWDNARREVRAIKGLLLNRRNFSLPSRTAA